MKALQRMRHRASDTPPSPQPSPASGRGGTTAFASPENYQALPPLPPAGEAVPQARVRVAREGAATYAPPCFGHATLTPTLSRQRERGATAFASPENYQALPLLPPAGKAVPQARVRVAREGAVTYAPPCFGDAIPAQPSSASGRGDDCLAPDEKFFINSHLL